MGHRLIDITGQRFGRWTAISKSARAGDSHPHWLCRCDCGTERVVAGGNLRSGGSVSCGCLRLVAPLIRPGQGEPLAWIESHVNFDGDECLFWPFARSHGYGAVTVEGKRMPAPRHMCQCVNGPPPSPEHAAAHSCGRGREGCMNPRHLRWATPVENEADKVIHGTHLQGERHPSAKLDDHTVLRIREQMLAGRRNKDVARLFGVSHSTINLAVKGKNWRSLSRSRMERDRDK